MFTSNSAFLAALLVVAAATLLISRWARPRWRPISVGAAVVCVGLLCVGFVMRSHEQTHRRAQLKTDTILVAQEVVQVEQQKLNQSGGYAPISYHDHKLSVYVVAVDGTHATAHVWSAVKDMRFKITPRGATPDPFAALAGR